jgi:hypothetical protein
VRTSELQAASRFRSRSPLNRHRGFSGAGRAYPCLTLMDRLNGALKRGKVTPQRVIKLICSARHEKCPPGKVPSGLLGRQVHIRSHCTYLQTKASRTRHKATSETHSGAFAYCLAVAHTPRMPADIRSFFGGKGAAPPPKPVQKEEEPAKAKRGSERDHSVK